WSGPTPPGHFRVQMRAREILLAGYAGGIRRANECVPHQPIHSFTQRLVERRFEIIPQALLPIRTNRGEAFVLRDTFTIGVRGGGWLFDKEPVLVTDAVLPRPCPEFAHRNIVPTKVTLGINWNRVRSAGFRVNAQAVLVRVVAEKFVVIIDGQ